MAGGVGVGLSLQVLKESAGERRSRRCGREMHRANELTQVGAKAIHLFGFYSLTFKLEISDLPIL